MLSETPTSPPEDDSTAVPIEIAFVVDANGQGWLVLAGIGGGDGLEIPIAAEDARGLVGALATYAYPALKLQSAPAAGHG